MFRLSLPLLLAAWLAGCAIQSPPSVPVEERSAPASPQVRPAPEEAPAPVPPAAPEPAPGYPVEIAPLPTPEAAPAPAPPAPSEAVPVPEPRQAPSGALLALLEQAESSHQAGQTQQALAQLERAQRIAPREPLVYLQLARLRLDLGDRARAEQLARKGLSLTSEPQMREAFQILLRQLAP